MLLVCVRVPKRLKEDRGRESPSLGQSEVKPTNQLHYDIIHIKAAVAREKQTTEASAWLAWKYEGTFFKILIVEKWQAFLPIFF